MGHKTIHTGELERGALRTGPRTSFREPKISVITVTNRYGSIDITWASLKKQTNQDFEWILADELYSEREREVRDFVDDDRLVHIQAPTDSSHLWNLNKAYNSALRVAKGDLVVSLQDYIWIRGDGLERFWNLYQALGPDIFLSGVGNKAAYPNEVHDPKGKITIFEEPYTDKPQGVSEYDSRLHGELKLEESNPSWWETNWAAAPLKAFKELGGYPEEHDGQFYGCDNLSISYRAHQLGYSFYLDKQNQSLGFPHSDYWPRPADWEEKHGRHGAWSKWYEGWMDNGKQPLAHLN